jgi:hypothetical protein
MVCAWWRRGCAPLVLYLLTVQCIIALIFIIIFQLISKLILTDFILIKLLPQVNVMAQDSTEAEYVDDFVSL